MTTLRAFLHTHRRMAALLLGFALVMKALIPAGYMLGQQAKVLTVEICADVSGARVTHDIVIPQHSKPGETRGGQAKSEGTCAFSALSMASLGGADAALLALALAFILALGFAPLPAAPLARLERLRPPLRGPPAHA